jgi:hypothetical protein
MSIRQCLADRVNEKRLFEVRPLLPSSKGRPRSVWAEKFVFDQLSPDSAAEEYALEAGRLRRKLEGIANGKRIVVGNRRDKDCDLKRLEPSANEVWEIRERDDPSVRIFVRFVERDCLAATNIRVVRDLFALSWFRNGLEFWPVWRMEIRRCKTIWRALFLTYPPHTGASLNDYLSNATGSGSF